MHSSEGTDSETCLVIAVNLIWLCPIIMVIANVHLGDLYVLAKTGFTVIEVLNL